MIDDELGRIEARLNRIERELELVTHALSTNSKIVRRGDDGGESMIREKPIPWGVRAERARIQEIWPAVPRSRVAASGAAAVRRGALAEWRDAELSTADPWYRRIAADWWVGESEEVDVTPVEPESSPDRKPAGKPSTDRPWEAGKLMGSERHQRLLVGLAQKVRDGESQQLDAAWAYADPSNLPGGISNNYFWLACGQLPDGPERWGHVKAGLDLYDSEGGGYDWDEQLSSVYWVWSAMGRASCLDVGNIELRARLLRCVRLDAWLMSLVMDSAGTCWHAGQRASYEASTGGSWVSDYARWLVRGERFEQPEPPRNPDRFSRGYWEQVWLASMARPRDAVAGIRDFGWSGDLYRGAQHLLMDARGGFHWKTPMHLYRYADGTLASRMEGHAGANTGPCLGLVKRPEWDRARVLWPWQDDNGDRIESVREGRIKASLIASRLIWKDGIQSINLGGEDWDMLSFPPGQVIEVILGPSGARVIVDGQEVTG